MSEPVDRNNSYRGSTWARLPASVEEARTMIDYHERILATSASRDRHQRSIRSLEWLRPLMASLERTEAAKREEAARLARIEASTPPDEELEVAWHGAMWH